jgi:hypothetical protein
MCCDPLFNRELSPAPLISVREPVGARATNPDVTVLLMDMFLLAFLFLFDGRLRRNLHK